MFHFFHRMNLTPVDPLGDGLREEIEAERQEADAIDLNEALDDEDFTRYWQEVADSIEE
jgi:hypothetical protein